MSQTEDQSFVKEGVEFFASLANFFEKEPSTAVWLFHRLVKSFETTIKDKETIQQNIQYYLGAIDVLDDIYWSQGNAKAVVKTISKPEILRKFLRVLVLLATTYNRINNNNNTDISDITDNLNDVTETLTDILKTVVENAGDDDSDDDSS